MNFVWTLSFAKVFSHRRNHNVSFLAPSPNFTQENRPHLFFTTVLTHPLLLSLLEFKGITANPDTLGCVTFKNGQLAFCIYYFLSKGYNSKSIVSFELFKLDD